LMDLPEVVPTAKTALGEAGLSSRVELTGGSFREDAPPAGADAISLIRVLYDHEDATVRALLAKVYGALPPGGRLVVSEPMAGGDRPERAGDLYFAFYTMAMGTGRARSQARIAELCAEAGFTDIRTPRPYRPFITSVVTAKRDG
jgi:demethylspheroidene O-methyltransferase